MTEMGVGAIVFACGLACGLGGMLASVALPEHHLTKETQDVVRLGMGVIATMSALVVGPLLASAKGSLDSKVFAHLGQ